MADEVSGNIISELRMRETFGGFSEDRILLLIEVIWNKLEYVLNCLLKASGRL